MEHDTVTPADVADVDYVPDSEEESSDDELGLWVPIVTLLSQAFSLVLINRIYREYGRIFSLRIRIISTKHYAVLWQ